MMNSKKIRKINSYLFLLRFKKNLKNIWIHFASWHWYEYLYLALFLILSILLISFNVWNNLQIITAVAAISSSFMAIFKKPTCFIYGFFHSIFYAIVCFNQEIFSSFLIFGCFISLCELIGLFLWIKHTDDGILKTQKLSLKKNLILLACIIVSLFVVMIFLNLLEANWIHAFLDAFSSITLAVGMSLMLTRFREQWFYWFAGDFMTMILWIYLFIHGNQDYIMLIMSIIMATLSLIGIIRWMIEIKK